MRLVLTVGACVATVAFVATCFAWAVWWTHEANVEQIQRVETGEQ